MVLEKNLNGIFELHSIMEHKFFKEFLKGYEIPDGLNHRHMRTLLVLNFKKKMSMSEMSHLLNIEKGSFTPVADKLIKMGYIINERSQQDRRKYEMDLTEKGRMLAEDFSSEHREYIKKLFEKLDDDEMLELSNAMSYVIKTLKRVSGADDNYCK